MVGGKNRQIFEALLLGRLKFGRGPRSMTVLTIDGSMRERDLAEVRELVVAGRLKPAIDRVFPFDSVVEAFRYVEEGHVRGKVVLTLPANA